MAKPFLRWAGSKRQLVGRLAEYWPGGRAKYIEPFAGSAHLFFQIEPRSAVLGDINSALMEVYEVVRDWPLALHEAFNAWANEEEQYYRVRAMDPNTLDKTVRAARLVYLNRFCFNGLYRTNGDGRFNVPYGGKRSGRLPSLVELEDASALLRQVKLVAGDFTTVLQEAGSGDFVYLDPPFSVQSRRVFREYDPASFGPADLKRMRAALVDLDSLGAIFLLSYADCAEGKLLAEGFHRSRVVTRRRIAGITDSRGTANELLVTNADAADLAQENLA